jgi:Sec-independent protein translocase protein TatA
MEGLFSPEHWMIFIVVLVVVLLAGGGKFLPRLGGHFGRSITGLKEGLKEGSEQFKSAMAEEEQKTKSTVAEKEEYDVGQDG